MTYTKTHLIGGGVVVLTGIVFACEFVWTLIVFSL